MFLQRLFLNHHCFVLLPPWSFFITCRQQPKLEKLFYFTFTLLPYQLLFLLTLQLSFVILSCVCTFPSLTLSVTLTHSFCHACPLSPFKNISPANRPIRLLLFLPFSPPLSHSVGLSFNSPLTSSDLSLSAFVLGSLSISLLGPYSSLFIFLLHLFQCI